MPATKSLRKLSILAVLIGVMALGPLAGQASASHFRGGNISYQQSGAATNADFESSVAFRCTYFFSPCNINAGDVVESRRRGPAPVRRRRPVRTATTSSRR